MLDNILNSVRRGAGRVQRRGEEVAQTTRLRLEVFQLTRELDTLYARLGRSYHGGADLGVLQGVRDDIRRVDEEIGARERLIRELSHEEPQDGAGEPSPEQQPSTLVVSPVSSPAVQSLDRPGDMSNPASDEGFAAGTEPTIPDAMPRPHSGEGAATSHRDGEPPPGGEPGR